MIAKHSAIAKETEEPGGKEARAYNFALADQ